MTIELSTTTNQPDTKSNPNANTNHNSTTKQHATHPDKFTCDNVVTPFVLPSIVILTLPLMTG